jgi:putative membrane protein
MQAAEKQFSSAHRFALIAIILLATALSLINPPFPHDMYLQHLGTLVLVIILLIDFRLKLFNRAAFLGIFLFALLHVFSARWVYSWVPYNEWSVRLFHFDINATFGFHRNEFDRFVHFAFSILIWPLLMQIYSGWKGNGKNRAAFLAWLTIQTAAMLYELFEYAITLVLSDEAATNYNGQQGDPWDSQKDMGMSLLSSTLLLLIVIIGSRIRRKSTKP